MEPTFEQRIVQSIPSHGPQARGVYVEHLKLDGKRGSYYIGSVKRYLSQRETCNVDASFAIIHDSETARRMLRTAQVFSHDHVMKATALGCLVEDETWVVAFSTTIHSTFEEWLSHPNRRRGIVLEAWRKHLRSLLNLLQGAHSMDFLIGESLTERSNYVFYNDEIYLVDRGSIQKTDMGKVTDVVSLSIFLRGFSSSCNFNEYMVFYTYLIDLMGSGNVGASHLLKHPFFYDFSSRDGGICQDDIFVDIEDTKGSLTRGQKYLFYSVVNTSFPDMGDGRWKDTVQQNTILGIIYNHNQNNPPQSLLRLARNGVVHRNQTQIPDGF